MEQEPNVWEMTHAEILAYSWVRINSHKECAQIAATCAWLFGLLSFGMGYFGYSVLTWIFLAVTVLYIYRSVQHSNRQLKWQKMLDKLIALENNDATT